MNENFLLHCPEKFDRSKENFDDFIKKNKPVQILDCYEDLLKDYFLIKNPFLRFKKNYTAEWEKFLKDHCQGNELKTLGEWFYFPWTKNMVHYLDNVLHQEIRTARNKNLVTPEEQKKLYNSVVGIAGLSVGSHAALTLAMIGGSRQIKLADPDNISGSNLNRIRYDFTQIGKSKVMLAAEYIYQLDPYAEIYIYKKGLNAENIKEFFNGPPHVDVFIEEMDNLEMKISSRFIAKSLGIPVVMATDNGDNIIVDIERYDLDKNIEIFNGAIGSITLEEFKNISPQELPRLAAKIVGPSLITPRMMESLDEVGKTLYSWPQLGNAATLCGAVLVYIVKQIILGGKLKSGKIEVNLDKIFISE